MKPRVGFLGTGWIGRHRMEAMLATGAIEAVAICDPAPECREQALMLAPGAVRVPDLDAMLALGVDGVVIATPSALHAEQSIAALRAGVAVFCQKPLGRTAAEVEAVVDAARTADRLLGLDLSYRHTRATEAIVERIRSGALGELFAIDLVFHNAYGPDKPWFYAPELSGGGCVIDLGVHLVDLAMWALDFPQAQGFDATLLARGRPVGAGEVEDYAVARFRLGPVQVRLACSWRLHAGVEAQIEASFYGTEGGAALRNVNGSFYDFAGYALEGTATRLLCAPPDAWGGRAAAAWAQRLSRSRGYDAAAERYGSSARVLDGLYGR